MRGVETRIRGRAGIGGENGFMTACVRDNCHGFDRLPRRMFDIRLIKFPGVGVERCGSVAGADYECVGS